MENLKIRLLTKEEIWGKFMKRPLSVIRSFGKRCQPTGLVHLKDDVLLSKGESSVCYYTQSPQYGNVIVFDNCMREASPTVRFPAVRPVIEMSKDQMDTLSKTAITMENGAQVDVCQYGAYPQKYVEHEVSEILEKRFKAKKLRQLKQKYTLVTTLTGEGAFLTNESPVFRFDGKSYIRITETDYASQSDALMSNRIPCGGPFWMSVEPIEWLMDPSGLLIAKKCLLNGVPLSVNKEEEYSGYSGDFQNTVLGCFLRDNFLPEIHQEEDVFELTNWLKMHPKPSKVDFLTFPKGEDKNIVSLLVEAGIDTLRQAFPPAEWINRRQDLIEIFATVDTSDPKTKETLRCLDARFRACAHKQLVRNLELKAKNAAQRQKD